MKLSLAIPTAVSAAYCVAVVLLVQNERTSHGSGFISLRSLGGWLVTLPSSLLFDPVLGRFDIDNNIHVGVSMLLNAGLIFGIAYLVLVKLFRFS